MPVQSTVDSRNPEHASPAIGVAACALSLIGVAVFLQTVLESAELSLSFFSNQRWRGVVAALGGRVAMTEAGPLGTVSLAATAGVAVAFGLFLTIFGVCLDRSGRPVFERMADASRKLAAAWSAAGIWWVLWIIALLVNVTWLATVLHEVVDLTVALCFALSLLAIWPKTSMSADAKGIGQESKLDEGSRGGRREPALWTSVPWRVLVAGMVLYVVIFTAMNWGLWFNLRIPHGDSAMYEEHLWNLEHGKGFRSYLDQGLFLGEHLQVVHILLVPVHLLFPSHLTLELAQSIILALGAWPVFNIARRHSGDDWAAALLGLAYLAYFPLQYLDIAIDLKTFRPNSFGIPALLAAIDLLERRRYGWAGFWLAITLSAQEDWAIPIALLGVYFAVHAFWTTGIDRRRELKCGVGLFVFGVTYLWLALNVVIPWFRGGATVHTASYFSKFGNTPREIIVTLLTDWPLVFSTIVTPAAVVYALRLLLPIGFLPLFSPGRLLVAAPLFLLLLMNDLAMQVPAPVHHFHATIIPILFWAAAAGLGSNRTVDQVVAMARRALGIGRAG